MTAPDHEQAERLSANDRHLVPVDEKLGRRIDGTWVTTTTLLDEIDRLAAQLAEAQEGFKASEFANDALEDRCQRAEDAADKAVAQLAERERALEQIADPSYVGNYSPEEVVSIYRKWALAATHSDSEASEPPPPPPPDLPAESTYRA